MGELLAFMLGVWPGTKAGKSPLTGSRNAECEDTIRISDGDDGAIWHRPISVLGKCIGFKVNGRIDIFNLTFNPGCRLAIGKHLAGECAAYIILIGLVSGTISAGSPKGSFHVVGMALFT